MAPPTENGALSARTVLEVADGLRWSDPRLGVSLAEHAMRLAGDDPTIRAGAQRSVIRSLAEVERFDEVVSRATPLLEDAVVRGDRDDLAGLLVELAAAAAGFGDHAVAAHLVEPVGPGDGLPAHTVAQAALVRAQLAGATGDVPGADRAAAEADVALQHTGEPEAGLTRRDLARARAAARSRSGDPATALTIVSAAVSAEPRADADGGRRSLLAAADQVDLLLDLGRSTEAVERGRAVLPPDPAGPLVIGAAARIRLALAERVHLAGGAHGEAQTSARVTADQLEAAGHDAAAARAWQVVASAAERSGDLAAALAAVRYGHDLESRARDRRDPSLRVLTMIAASAPELPPRPAPAAPAAEPAAPEASEALGLTPPPGYSTLSEMESLLADARSSLAAGTFGGTVGTSALPQRRGHHRQDRADPEPPIGSETAPEALARLLGDAGVTTDPAPGTGEAPGGGERVNGSRAATDDVAAEDLATDAGLAAPRRGRDGRSMPARDDVSAEPPEADRADTGSRPTFDVVSPTSERGSEGGMGPESGLPDVAGPSETQHESSTSEDRGSGRSDTSRSRDRTEFPDIDPRDPLGTASSTDVGSTSVGTGGVGTGGVGAARTTTSSSRSAPDSAPDPGDALSRTTAPDPQPPRRRADGGAAADDGDGRRQETLVPPELAPAPGSGGRAELDEELALTLAGLLAEYRAAETPSSPRPRDRHPSRSDQGRPADVAVPSARRHVSGSMPVPGAEQRFAVSPADAAGRTPPDLFATGDGARRGENGTRLADLLAEAMDAFRHTGVGDGGPDDDGAARNPGGTARGAGDGARPPGVGARRR